MTRLRSYHSKGILEAGVDEVGRGCLAGPVVAAAVVLKARFYHPLLNDSKQVSARHRIELADYIKEKALCWSIAEVDNNEIDRINILQATFKAMHLALSSLSDTPEHILVDGNRFLPYPFIPHTCIVKGDSKFKSIAAASILAKVYRDELMAEWHKTYPEYGWERNVGYPTSEHRSGLEKSGPCPLHRMSFKLFPELSESST